MTTIYTNTGGFSGGMLRLQTAASGDHSSAKLFDTKESCLDIEVEDYQLIDDIHGNGHWHHVMVESDGHEFRLVVWDTSTSGKELASIHINGRGLHVRYLDRQVVPMPLPPITTY